MDANTLVRVENISIHAPQWGATWGIAICPRSKFVFQSTHPSGVRLKISCANDVTDTISIHAPQWGATRRVLIRITPPIFQSTHPSGVRRVTNAIFNSIRAISIHAPQWGATASSCCATLSKPISIHAPQWGATHRRVLQAARRSISIHAPQWGATLHCHGLAAWTLDFNPRTPVGCDSLECPWTDRPPSISIHAPQWGATVLAATSKATNEFQSTHPSGVRPP